MNACGLLHFDFRECVFGWVPDWVWGVFRFIGTYWPWIVGFVVFLIVLGILYRIKMVAGWPGVVAALVTVAVGFGYFLGVRQRGDKEPVAPDDRASPASQVPGFRAPKQPRGGGLFRRLRNRLKETETK